MRRHERWRLLCFVLFAGIAFTLLVETVLREKRRAAAARAAEMSVTGTLADTGVTGRSYRDFREKFEDTDRTIAILREKAKKDSRADSETRFATSELRYWETQLNALCQVLPAVLSEQEAAAFTKDQQEWRRKRDVPAESGAVLSVREQAENTRARAYQLREQYKDRKPKGKHKAE